jgi:hypothetical protein
MLHNVMNYAEFFWQVPADGYIWERAKLVRPIASKSGDKFFSNTNALLKKESALRIQQYDPMRAYPGLFRTFAALEPTDEAILQFSMRFGWLQGAYSVVTAKGEEKKGEPVDLWTEQIATMKCTVDMWDMFQSKDRAGLAKYIEWREFEGVFFKGAANVEGRLVEFPPFHSELIPDGDTRLPAIYQIIHMVTKGLHQGVRLQLAYDLDDNQAQLRQVPINLLACLWLQLANTISERICHRQCPGCGTWFEIGGKGARTDKKYCSDACRMRVNRETLERARVRAKIVQRKRRKKAELEKSKKGK